MNFIYIKYLFIYYFSIGSNYYNNKIEKLWHNSIMSIYAISKDLEIPPIAGTCVDLQVKCFCKSENFNYIIRKHIKFIPPMSHYSWTKESRSLRNKLKKHNCNKISEIKNYSWKKIFFSNNRASKLEIMKRTSSLTTDKSLYLVLGILNSISVSVFLGLSVFAADLSVILL